MRYLASKLMVCLMTVLLFGACGGQYRQTLSEFEQDIPTKFSQVSEAQNPEVLTAEPTAEQLSRWWHEFEVDDLNLLLEDVLRGNYDIQIAVARVEQADARSREARSKLWPMLSASGDVTRTRTNVQAFNSTFTGGSSSTTGSVTSTRYGVSAPVVYEVDVWGRIRKANQAASKELLASEEDLAAVLMTLSADVVETYFLGVELCRQRALLEQTITADQKFHDLIEKRYRDGVADPLDVYQARENLATRRAEWPNFEEQLVEVQHRLQIFAGKYPEYFNRCENAPELPNQLEPLPVGLPASLLLRRPDIRSLLLQLEAADARYAAALRNRLPGLRLSGSAGYEGLEFSELFRPETFVWNLLGDITLTLFDGGEKRARASLAEAQVAELLARYLRQSLEAFGEVEDALSSERYAHERVRLIREKVAASRKTLRLSTEQYLQGVKDYLPVLVAQASFYRSQRELISARRILLTQRVQLARALGGSWGNVQMASIGGRNE